MSIKGMNEFKSIFPDNEENENAGSKASCVIIWSGKIEISKTKRTRIFVNCL